MAIHGRFDLSGFFSFIPIKNRCPNHFRNACSAGIESRFGPGICHRCPSLPSCSAQGIPSSGRADQPSQQYLLLFPSANRNALPVGFGIRFRFAGTAYGHGNRFSAFARPLAVLQAKRFRSLCMAGSANFFFDSDFLQRGLICLRRPASNHLRFPGFLFLGKRMLSKTIWLVFFNGPVYRCRGGDQTDNGCYFTLGIVGVGNSRSIA